MDPRRTASCDEIALSVRGDMPRGLTGTLIYNERSRWFNRPGDPWGTGDGVRLAFRFERGRVYGCLGTPVHHPVGTDTRQSAVLRDPPGRTVMNAWKESRRFQLDLMQAVSVAHTEILPICHAFLARWTFGFDHDRGGGEHEWLCDIPGRDPCIDDRWAGHPHRHGWFIGDAWGEHRCASIVHIDHAEGRLDVHPLAAAEHATNPCFVPMSVHAAEGIGWLFSATYCRTSDHTELLVFDAQQLHDGPVAAVRLTRPMPAGLQGCWIAEPDQLVCLPG